MNLEQMEKIANELRCPCGGVILADTEDWPTPLCDQCSTEMFFDWMQRSFGYAPRDVKDQFYGWRDMREVFFKQPGEYYEKRKEDLFNR